MKRTATLLIGIGVFSLTVVLAAQQTVPVPQLPAPTPARPNFGSVVPKPADAKLTVPQGFTVELYADNVPNARLMEFASNGDLFVSQPDTNVITVFRDTNRDGIQDARFVYAQGAAMRGGGFGGGGGGRGRGGRGAADPAAPAPAPPPPPANPELNRPFGLAFHNGFLYVGNQDGVIRYKYTAGDTKAAAAGEKVADLPPGANHWTKGVIFSRDGRKMYVSVGSTNNIDETGRGNEQRAAIHEFNPDGTGGRLFATGIRNPVGLALQPGTNTLWTAVNERDGLGDELVPDYATSVKDGGFYGWPYSYFGTHVDTRVQNQKPEMVAKAIVPDIAIPAHSAALGLTFYSGTQFPQRYRNGLFIALHGSWNRSTTAGAKVVFVPFANNRPSGPIEDFLTGFVVDPTANSKWGRPVGVTVTPDGSLLVSEDGGGSIWRIRATAAR
jgi:glucose/arabinose dehydrogenase